MTEIESLEEQIAKKQEWVTKQLSDPHRSSFDTKIIKAQQKSIEELQRKLKALKKGKTISEPNPVAALSREEHERGQAAKQNMQFPKMKYTKKGVYKTHEPVHVSPVSFVLGCNVTIR